MPAVRPAIALRLCPLLLLLGLVLPGCAYYSFTGASVPEHLRTIAIPLAEDASVGPMTNMADNLTRLLIDRFVGQTRLRLQPDENEADALLTVRIDRYVNEPTAVSGTDRAQLNRVTIYVTAVYTDRTKNEELMRRSFSGYTEYDPQAANALDAEIEAAQRALVIAADDIFTGATSNW